MKIYRERQDGQGLVEYALVLVLVAVVVIAILTMLGPQISGVFARISAGLNGQVLMGSGLEYAYTSFNVSVTGSAPSCTVNVGASVIALQDGVPIGNQAVSVTVLVNNVNRGSLTGTTSGNGTVTLTPNPLAATGAPCSGTVTLQAGGSASGTVSKGY